MHHIAILGFGVVGRGVADLCTENEKEVSTLGGEKIEIRRVLDLRDFPGTPYEKIVTHSFDDIVNDKEIDTVIEAMGGSHPAREYTLALLNAGKNVITSNKEVVANYGTEFLRAAEEHGCVYRFEAAVGGGIPVLSPLMSMLGQNRITEVRGILNGTTNYILTQMFSFGASFEDALRDAQEKGYAERNPDADILGTDACRKTAILAALVCGKAVPTDRIPTEGITHIRAEDVKAASAGGFAIRLLGRAHFDGERVALAVGPHFVRADNLLSSVSGVYNAVEVVGEPIGNVVLYGKGAGAGATASAVVGDLMLILREGRHYAVPKFAVAKESDTFELSGLPSCHYVAFEGKAKLADALGNVCVLSEGDECAVITERMSGAEFSSRLEALRKCAKVVCTLPVLD